jgi:hypothetical protein
MVVIFIKPWRYCPSCHQEYQNELRIDIASKFALFVRRQYSDDTRRQVEALGLKLRALNLMLDRLTAEQKREAGVMANVIISLIDRMKTEVSSLPMRYSQMETYAYNAHGRIALDEGSEESARRAVVHFKKALEVSKAIGDAGRIASVKTNIAIAKSKFEGDSNNEEGLKASQSVYELRAAKFGEENGYTIEAGITYAGHLQKVNRGEEARKLLMKLLTTSKQVFGPHHNQTKDIESTLKRANR